MINHKNGLINFDSFANPDTIDTLQLLVDSKVDLGTLDETLIKDEKTKNLIHAIKVRRERAEHTDFYYMLDKVNDRIYMYKSLFMEKKPRFMK